MVLVPLRGQDRRGKPGPRDSGGGLVPDSLKSRPKKELKVEG